MVFPKEDLEKTVYIVAQNVTLVYTSKPPHLILELQNTSQDVLQMVLCWQIQYGLLLLESRSSI